MVIVQLPCVRVVRVGSMTLYEYTVSPKTGMSSLTSYHFPKYAD